MDGLFHPVLKHGTGYGDREYLPGTKRAATIIVGYCGCLVMLVAMHIILVPDQNSQPPAIGVRQDAGQTFDPAQCEAPPLSCWDGYNKRGGVYCVRAKQALHLRGGQAVLQPGNSTCYKAVYFNVERATYIIAGWFLLWFLMASRGLERLASAWLEGQLCPWAAAAVLVNQASLWYSTSALIHYTNDYWFDFYWSQMYYTLSEGYLYVLAAVLLRRDAQPPLLLLVAALGIAVYHIAQLLLDEALNMAVSMHALRRGTLLLVTDVSYIGALLMSSVIRRALQQGSSRMRLAAQVAVAALLNAAVFYLVFADRASYGAS